MSVSVGDKLYRVVMSTDGIDEWEIEARVIERETPTYYYLKRGFSFVHGNGRIAKNMLGFTCYVSPDRALDAFAREQAAVSETGRQQVERANRAMVWATHTRKVQGEARRCPICRDGACETKSEQCGK